MFKILNLYYQIDPNYIFTLQQDSVTKRISIGQHLLNFRIMHQWNDLPKEVVLAKEHHRSNAH